MTHLGTLQESWDSVSFQSGKMVKNKSGGELATCNKRIPQWDVKECRDVVPSMHAILMSVCTDGVAADPRMLLLLDIQAGKTAKLCLFSR